MANLLLLFFSQYAFLPTCYVCLHMVTSVFNDQHWRLSTLRLPTSQHCCPRHLQGLPKSLVSNDYIKPNLAWIYGFSVCVYIYIYIDPRLIKI
jgi:hypothetical protein